MPNPAVSWALPAPHPQVSKCQQDLAAGAQVPQTRTDRTAVPPQLMAKLSFQTRGDFLLR